MYGLSYEQLKRRTVISLVLGIIGLVAMFVMFLSHGGIEAPLLIGLPFIIIAFTLEILGMIVCWRELGKSYLDCMVNAVKSLVGAGATGIPVIGFFIEFAKSFVVLTIAIFKSLIVALKVLVFVLKGKNNED